MVCVCCYCFYANIIIITKISLFSRKTLILKNKIQNEVLANIGNKNNKFKRKKKQFPQILKCFAIVVLVFMQKRKEPYEKSAKSLPQSQYTHTHK